MERLLVRLAMFCHRVWRRARRALGLVKTVYVQDRVPYFFELWRAAAADLGWQFVSLSRSVWEVRDGEHVVSRINNFVVQLDDPVTLDVAGDKLLTYKLLAEAGLTIPRYASFDLESLGELRRFTEREPGPFVIKPARNTSSGLGVTTNLKRHAECLNAAALAFTYCEEALVEPQIAGESYRLLFLGGRMLCASRRTGLRVTGDGVCTIAELVERATGGRRVDDDIRSTLAAQRLTLQTVVPNGNTVLARSAGAGVGAGTREVRTIYTDDVTDLVCSAIVEEGRRASVALGTEFCGVDVITTDPTVPLAASGGAINEVNTTPGLHHHYGLGTGAPREPLANVVLRYVAAKRRAGRSS
jgi:cyanophycin synthetase